MNNVHAGVAIARSDCICLFDDDARPTPNTVLAISDKVMRYGLVRAMVTYQRPDFFDCTDIAGIFFINTVSKQPQFWANICFNYKLVTAEDLAITPGLKNSVFDELSIERHVLNKGGALFYQKHPSLPMASSSRSLSCYLEQRVRYAYENLAFPVRTTLFASLLPLLLVGALFFGYAATVGSIAATTIVVLLISFIGRSYGATQFERSLWIYAPLWFWPYTLTTWLALGLLARGGLERSGKRVRRPA